MGLVHGIVTFIIFVVFICVLSFSCIRNNESEPRFQKTEERNVFISTKFHLETSLNGRPAAASMKFDQTHHECFFIVNSASLLATEHFISVASGREIESKIFTDFLLSFST